jgi:hypothetical protein
VIADWAKSDVTTAEQFLLDAPAEKIPEEAIASFIVAARQSNPATAAKWLDKIPPGPKREALSRLFEP